MRKDVKIIFDHFKKLYGTVNSSKKINVMEQIQQRRFIVENYGSIDGKTSTIDPEITTKSVRIRSIPCEWICAPNADKNKVLFYIHGGGFFGGSLNSHRALSCEISKRAGVSVLAIDYRLAPENPFPAGLEDCLDVYDWLLENGPDGKVPPKSIFIAGDSAGGTLALSLLLKIKKLHLRMPNAVLPISPVVDFAGKGTSIDTLEGLDPVINKKGLIQGLPLVYLFGKELMMINQSKIKNLSIFFKVFMKKRELIRNPLVSPIYGDLTGLPPIFINVGELELIRDDAIRFGDIARKQGVDIIVKVWPDMVHVFIAFLGYVPEAEQCYSEMADFIKVHS